MAGWLRGSLDSAYGGACEPRAPQDAGRQPGLVMHGDGVRLVLGSMVRGGHAWGALGWTTHHHDRPFQNPTSLLGFFVLVCLRHTIGDRKIHDIFVHGMGLSWIHCNVGV